MKQVKLHLAKQNFKFSSAHFLIFDAQKAEMLHGHNYQVKVEIALPVGAVLGEQGYFVDFNVFKKHIKAQLDLWDEHVLLPGKNKELKTQVKAATLEVNFRDRFYAFPVKEVVLLPITNTSVEQLAELLAQDFLKAFKSYGIASVRVMVAETQGQAASVKLSVQS